MRYLRSSSCSSDLASRCVVQVLQNTFRRQFFASKPQAFASLRLLTLFTASQAKPKVSSAMAMAASKVQGSSEAPAALCDFVLQASLRQGYFVLEAPGAPSKAAPWRGRKGRRRGGGPLNKANPEPPRKQTSPGLGLISPGQPPGVV